jgi:hypothetical protein
MSFRGIAEFVLQIDHFRNIDLLQQGLYYLRIQIFNEDLEKVSTSCGIKPIINKVKVPCQHHVLEALHIDE